MKKHLTALLLLSATPTYADPGFPDEPSVQTALDGHPLVEAAKARIEVARAEERALKAGPYEFGVSGSYIRRSVAREGTYNEYDATLSRPFRLPGKARLDIHAGAFGVAAAENHWEDAKHQTALLLAELWWDWLGASGESQIDEQAVTNLDAAQESVRRRVALRDAARLEADQAEAALGAARLAAAQSQGRASLARARLKAQFPLLPLPDLADELPLPESPPTGFAIMRDQVVLRSHEIAAAEAEAKRASTLAERATQGSAARPYAWPSAIQRTGRGGTRCGIGGLDANRGRPSSSPSRPDGRRGCCCKCPAWGGPFRRQRNGEQRSCTGRGKLDGVAAQSRCRSGPGRRRPKTQTRF